MSIYWPWWGGALALGTIAVVHARMTGRPMGVSSSFAKVAHASSERDAEKTVDETRTPLAAHIAFLAMMAVGALIAGFVRGAGHVHASLGPTYEKLFGTGGAMLAALALGGVLVGVGTRMSGGCTSGHGLSGCARLSIRSLVATATFLGVAIATANLLQWVLI